MSKQKRKNKHLVSEHTVQFPHVGFITFSPSRESEKPFCAYYGPNGETCSSTTMLETVATLPSSPPIAYMACPVHFDDLQIAVQRFLTHLENLSKQ